LLVYFWNWKNRKRKKGKKEGGDCWRKVSSVCLIPLLNPSDKKKKKEKLDERERGRF